MSDLISKRFIQDALIEKISNLNAEGATQTARELIRLKKFVDGLTPPASADAVHGEWIKATGMMPPEFHGHHCCSECGNFANMEPPFGNREDLSNFCPNCGADMRNGM